MFADFCWKQEQWYVKIRRPSMVLARKIWTWHLEMFATPYFNMHLQMVLFKGLKLQHTWCFTKHVSKNHNINKTHGQFTQGKFIEEEVPLNNIH